MGNEEEYKEPSKFDEFTEKLGSWFYGIAAVLLFVWWAIWWDHTSVWSDEITAYPITCSKNYKNNDCPGDEKLVHPISYMVNKERAEVVVMTIKGIPPKALTKCSIFDIENWKCPGGDGLPSVYFADGLPQSNNSKVRYVSQWRYRFFELWELF